MARPTAVSFYTEEYEQDARRLKQSLIQFDYPHDVVKVPNSGYWVYNCAYKAKFCLEKIKEFDGPILWIDSDAWLKQELTFFDNPSFDFAIWRAHPNSIRPPMQAMRYKAFAQAYGGLFGSYLVYFNNTPTILKLMEAWVRNCMEELEEWDQVQLQKAYAEVMGADASFSPLPNVLRPGGPVIGHESGYHRYWKGTEGGRQNPEAITSIAEVYSRIDSWAEQNKTNPPSSKAGTFLWTSPYLSSRISDGYLRAGGKPYMTRKIAGLQQFTKFVEAGRKPNLLIMHNFIPKRHELKKLALDNGVNVVHGEDGWFPHGTTIHADPMGFCWESSLCQMQYSRLIDKHRKRAELIRKRDKASNPPTPFTGVKRPYVLFPTQLLRDQVNVHGLNMRDWTPLIKKTLLWLPEEFDLVIKQHPRDKSDPTNLNQLVSQTERLHHVPTNTNLQGLIQGAQAVVGINSTVLYESRLIYHKPVWCYGKSWFTNHVDIFPYIDPADDKGPESLDFLHNPEAIRNEYLDDYTNWFLAQLGMRQVPKALTRTNPGGYIEFVHKMSWNSWIQHGEAIFS